MIIAAGIRESIVAINLNGFISSRAAKWFFNRIRQQALAMGHDLSGLSDEQLATGMAQSGISITKNGLSATDAKELIRILASAIKNIGK